jgi:hypothetical protein
VKRHNRNLPFLYACLLLAALVLWGGACTTFVKTDADGTRWEYYSFLKTTSVEQISVPTANGTATLKGGGGDTSAAVADTAATLRMLAGTAAKAAR